MKVGDRVRLIVPEGYDEIPFGGEGVIIDITTNECWPYEVLFDNRTQPYSFPCSSNEIEVINNE